MDVNYIIWLFNKLVIDHKKKHIYLNHIHQLNAKTCIKKWNIFVIYCLAKI